MRNDTKKRAMGLKPFHKINPNRSYRPRKKSDKIKGVDKEAQQTDPTPQDTSVSEWLDLFVDGWIKVSVSLQRLLFLCNKKSITMWKCYLIICSYECLFMNLIHLTDLFI